MRASMTDIGLSALIGALVGFAILAIFGLGFVGIDVGALVVVALLALATRRPRQSVASRDMSDNDELILHPGVPANDEDMGWIPRIALQHEGENGHELYVVVGEEVGGMIEHVPFEAMEGIRARLFADDELGALFAAVMGNHIDAEALNRAIAKLDAVVGGGG